MKNKTKTVYYSDELNDEFSSAKITARTIGWDYRYVHGNPFYRFFNAIFYRCIAKPAAFLFLKIRFGWKVKNGKILKKAEKGQGVFLYANHTNAAADPFVPAMLTKRRRAYVIVHPANVSIPFMGRAIAALGALPLPSDRSATKNFLAAVDTRVKQGAAVCVYPEAHIWPYYTKIRPFPDTSFRYPVQYGAIVYTFTNTYQKRKFFKTPRIVTYVDGPFIPDTALPVKESRRKLRDEAYGAMVKRSELSNVEYVRYVPSAARNKEEKKEPRVEARGTKE